MSFRSLKFRKYRLMTPGPVPLPKKVLKSLALPMIHHRTPEFEKLLCESLEKLKKSFQTQQAVMPLVSTGSGAMEAAIVNTLSPGDEVLVVVAGKFGERWADIAKRYGLTVRTLEIPWGEAVHCDQIEQAFIQLPHIKAVLCQACETSTATANPIKKIADCVSKRQNTLFMVDAITGIGAMDLPMDQLNIDVLISGSQKAFLLPTGLSFIALSEKAWSFYKSSKCPKYYFDLGQERKANDKNQTFFSSAVSHIRALNVALDELTGDKLKKCIERSQQMAKATRLATEALGLKVYSKAPADSVTAIELPSDVDGAKLRGHIESRYNITLMGGQGPLKGRILRVGHLGPISNKDLKITFEAIYLSMNELGHKIPPQQLDGALKVLDQELR